MVTRVNPFCPFAKPVADQIYFRKKTFSNPVVRYPRMDGWYVNIAGFAGDRIEGPVPSEQEKLHFVWVVSGDPAKGESIR